MRDIREGERVRIHVKRNTLYHSMLSDQQLGFSGSEAQVIDKYTKLSLLNNLEVNCYVLNVDGGRYCWTEDMFDLPEEDAPLLPVGTYVKSATIADNAYLLKIVAHRPNRHVPYEVELANVDRRVHPGGGARGIRVTCGFLELADAEQMAYFGVNNNHLVKKEPNNEKLNIFKDNKYRLDKIRTLSKDGRKQDTYCYIIDESKSKGSFGGIKSIAFINNDGKLHLGLNKKVNLVTMAVIDYKEAVKQLCKVRIKSCEDSIKLFLHATKKRDMLKQSQEEKKLFSITNIILDYEKNEEKHDIVEVFNGEISLKFKLTDVEFVQPNLSGISIPKDRTIDKGTLCRVIRNKHLPISKNTTVKVLEMRNISDLRHGSNNKYNKSTIVKVATEDNKQFSCRIRNLKKI